MNAPTYADYVANGGRLSELDYNLVLPKAVAHVDWLIGWKEVPAEHEDAVKRAILAVLDAFTQYGAEALGGFAIGSFRMDNSAEFNTGKEIATDAAWEFLAPTGLLFSGVR